MNRRSLQRLTRTVFGTAFGLASALSFMPGCNRASSDSAVSASEVDAGFLSVPKALCAGSACLPRPSTFVANPLTPYAITEDLNANVIPAVNAVLADVLAFAAKVGVSDCAGLVSYPDPLVTVGSETFAFITSSRVVPADFPNAGASFGKRIRYTRNDERIAELDLRCGSDTAADPFTLYVRMKLDGLQAEIYYQKFANQIRFIGASILPNLNRMIAWFKTNDGTVFSMEAARRVGLEEQHYRSRGYRAGQRFLISDEISPATACLNGSGTIVSPASCPFSLETSPAPTVTNQSAWSNIDIVGFTILNP